LGRNRKKNKEKIKINTEKEDISQKNQSGETPFNDAIKEGIFKADEIVSSLNSIQINFTSLLVGSEDERLFYERKVRPLVDQIYFLAQAAQGSSIAAQNIQSNIFVKKRQVKLSLDLTYDLLKESLCLLEVLKQRNSIYRSIIEADLDRCKNNLFCNDINELDNFCDTNEDIEEDCSED